MAAAFRPAVYEETVEQGYPYLCPKLSNVYWVGGAPGAGKSTIARRLAENHGLHRYATDEVVRDHAARTTADESPYLHRFMAMEMNERWMTRSPQTILDTFPWFRGEAFDLIVEDLLRLSATSAAAGGRYACLGSASDPPGLRVRRGLRVLPHRRPMNAEPLGDRQHALPVRPGGSHSVSFLLCQRGPTTATSE
jgi:hypothetical protein